MNSGKIVFIALLLSLVSLIAFRGDQSRTTVLRENWDTGVPLSTEFIVDTASGQDYIGTDPVLSYGANSNLSLVRSSPMVNSSFPSNKTNAYIRGTADPTTAVLPLPPTASPVNMGVYNQAVRGRAPNIKGKRFSNKIREGMSGEMEVQVNELPEPDMMIQSKRSPTNIENALTRNMYSTVSTTSRAKRAAISENYIRGSIVPTDSPNPIVTSVATSYAGANPSASLFAGAINNGIIGGDPAAGSVSSQDGKIKSIKIRGSPDMFKEGTRIASGLIPVSRYELSELSCA